MRIPGTTPTKKIPGAWPGIRNLAGLERDSVPAGTPIELVVHADLGNRELVLEIRVHSDGWRPDDTQRRKVDGVRLALAVEFDVVVLDEGGPVRSDHVLAAQAEQPTKRHAFRAGQCLSSDRNTRSNGGEIRKVDGVCGVHPRPTTLDVDQSTVGDYATEAARHRSQPVALRGA